MHRRKDWACVATSDHPTYTDNGCMPAPAEAPVRPPARHVRRSTFGDRVRFVLQVLGELLITFGIVVLLFAVYELKITDLRAAATQRDLRSELTKTWQGEAPARPNGPDPAVTVAEGQPFAEIRVPRLGTDYARVVVEGV